jgi:hypothetical protein
MMTRPTKTIRELPILAAIRYLRTAMLTVSAVYVRQAYARPWEAKPRDANI